MADRLSLDDLSLGEAGRALVTASSAMAHGNARVPTTVLPSLTGIGERIDLYLRGLAVARAALADAARTASMEIAVAMRESADLDAAIATRLPGGFAVRGEAP